MAKRKDVGGRPPRGGKTSTETIKLRVTPDERRAWESEAAGSQMTLSEWLRNAAKKATRP